MPSLAQMLAEKQAKEKAAKEAAEAEAKRKAATVITPEKPISMSIPRAEPDQAIPAKPVKPRAPRAPRESKPEVKFDFKKEILPEISKVFDSMKAEIVQSLKSEIQGIKPIETGDGIKHELDTAKGDIIKAE